MPLLGYFSSHKHLEFLLLPYYWDGLHLTHVALDSLPHSSLPDDKRQHKNRLFLSISLNVWGVKSMWIRWTRGIWRVTEGGKRDSIDASVITTDAEKEIPTQGLLYTGSRRGRPVWCKSVLKNGGTASWRNWNAVNHPDRETFICEIWRNWTASYKLICH